MRGIYVFLLSVMIAGILLSSSTVVASSWGRVDHQEVVERADVIVTGRYDFSKKSPSSRGIFAGFSFAVEHVYKGDIPQEIVAGVDGNDVL